MSHTHALTSGAKCNITIVPAAVFKIFHRHDTHSYACNRENKSKQQHTHTHSLHSVGRMVRIYVLCIRATQSSALLDWPIMRMIDNINNKNVWNLVRAKTMALNGSQQPKTTQPAIKRSIDGTHTLYHSNDAVANAFDAMLYTEREYYRVIEWFDLCVCAVYEETQLNSNIKFPLRNLLFASVSLTHSNQIHRRRVKYVCTFKRLNLPFNFRTQPSPYPHVLYTIVSHKYAEARLPPTPLCCRIYRIRFFTW